MALNAFDVGFAISVFDRASGPLNRIRSSYRTLNLETQKYEKRMMAGFKLLAGGYVAAASGMAALGAATKLAVQATDFQKQIDQLKIVASQSGLADSKLSGLRKTILAVASDTTFAADDLAKASRTFIQRGFAGVGTTDAGLRATAAFSEISLGQIGIGKAAEIGAQSIAAFRREGEADFETLNRVLATAAFVGNNTALTFDKLPLVMGRIARSAAASGLEFSHLASAAGKATGQLGSHRIASTGVATLLESLSKEGREAKLLKMFGLEGKQIRQVKGGFATLIDTITAQMGDQFSENDAINMGRRIAESLKMSPKDVSILTGAALAAKNAKKPFSDFVKAAEEAGRAGMEPLQEIIKKKYYQTIGGQLELLSGKFTNFKILLGETFGPALGSVTKLLNTTFDAINDFLGDENNFARLKAGAESFIKGAFISTITGISALLTGAVLLLGPVIAPMIPLMVAMGAAVAVITNNLGESFGGFRNLGTAIADAAKVMISGDDAFLGDKTSDRFNNANRVVKTLSSSFDFLKGVFEGIMVVIKPLVSLVEALVGGLKSLAGVFGGEGGSGGAGKLLGQVLMGGMLFKGAGKFLGLGGGAAAAMGGGAARGALAGGAARGAAASRGGSFASNMWMASRGAAAADRTIAARSALTRLPVPGQRPGTVAPLTTFQKNRMAPLRNASASLKRKVALGGAMRGARVASRMGGALSIGGLVAGAAAGQALSPDNALGNLAITAGVMKAVDAIPVTKIGAKLGGALSTTALSVAAKAPVGGLLARAATFAATGPAGWVAGTAAAAVAIGTLADRTYNLSDRMSDFAMSLAYGTEAGRKETKARGLVANNLKNADLFGEGGGLAISEASKKRFFERTGQTGRDAFAQRKSSLLSARDSLSSIVDEQVKRELDKARTKGETIKADDPKTAEMFRQRAKKSLLQGGDARFKKATEQFTTQKLLFQQMMEKNELLTKAQQETQDKIQRMTDAGVDAAVS
jgi:TP901 family phage tail tape measure protein